MNDIENTEIVFKDGVGYESQKLLDSTKGRYGQYEDLIPAFGTAIPKPTRGQPFRLWDTLLRAVLRLRSLTVPTQETRWLRTFHDVPLRNS